jgi:hypothetical protein
VWGACALAMLVEMDAMDAPEMDAPEMEAMDAPRRRLSHVVGHRRPFLPRLPRPSISQRAIPFFP